MSTYDHSFHAEGDNDPNRLVAFETAAPALSYVHTFGVAVYAKQCGVNAIGVSLATLGGMSPNPHYVAPNGVGVHGLGDVEGVQGEGPVGVRGIGSVPGTIGGMGIGVQGEGGDAGVNGQGTAAGVRGSGNIGVQGLGGDAGVEGRGFVGVRGMGQSTTSGPSTGVRGTGDFGVQGDGRIGVRGEGRDAGVLGFSRENRGGVFHTGPHNLPPIEQHNSDPSAQILLVPVQVSGRVEANLPRAGLAGDLLAVVRIDEKGTPAELWFCTKSGSNNPGQPGATWAQVQFGTTHTVP